MTDGVQILIVVNLLLTTAICCWRFYLRLVVTRRHLAIELTLLAGLLAHITMGGLQIQMVKLINTASSPRDIVVMQKYFFSGTFFYLSSLWCVKISINLLHVRLTLKFPSLNVWAIRSLWFLILSLPVMFVLYLVACLPIHRHWNSPLGTVKACPTIMRSWDFWIHLVVHISTDIWLCILPFPILLQIQEKRLRIAVCGVYGLTLAAIIVSLVRAILLGIDAQAKVKYIVALTSIELTTTIIIGSIPGISSSFTRKYLHGSNGSQSRSTQSGTRKTSTFHQQQQWETLATDHESNQFSGSVDCMELRDEGQLSVRSTSTRGSTTEDAAASADRVDKVGTVAITMV